MALRIRVHPCNTTRIIRHAERHRTQRIGWLRAAVLGANDGIVSFPLPASY